MESRVEVLQKVSLICMARMFISIICHTLSITTKLLVKVEEFCDVDNIKQSDKKIRFLFQDENTS